MRLGGALAGLDSQIIGLNAFNFFVRCVLILYVSHLCKY